MKLRNPFKRKPKEDPIAQKLYEKLTEERATKRESFKSRHGTREIYKRKWDGTPTSYQPTAFGGADVVLSMNDKLRYEVAGIEYSESFSPLSLPVIGSVVITMLSGDVFAADIEEENTLVLDYSNEYGHRRQVKLNGVVFTSRKGGVHMDDMMVEETFTFRAKSIEEVDKTAPALIRRYAQKSVV